MAPPHDQQPDLTHLLRQVIEYLNENRIAEAEAVLTAADAMLREVPQATMLLGVVRLKQKRHAEAEALLETVLRKHPDQPAALLQLGNLRSAQGRTAAAIETYRRALSVRPDFMDAALALASALKQSGKLEEARQWYDFILQRMPGQYDAIAGLGHTLIGLQDYSEAERILAKGERLAGDRNLAAEIAEGLGTAKMLQRRFSEALPHFERALALNPSLTEAQRKRATVLEHLRQSKRAAQAYRDILKQKPGDLKTHLLLNELIHREGPNADLLASYDDAARRQPASAALPAAKADQLLLLERPAEAAEAYRRALRLDSNHLAARIGLARVLDRLGDAQAAGTAFETGLASHPDDPSLKTAYAFHLLQQRDAKKAKYLAEGAARAAPLDQAALAVLGLCYRATGDGREDDINDYEHFIRVFDLKPPAGYADMAAFHRDLGAQLDQLHGQAGQFFSQTLRGGTRASEGIFEFREKTRDLLKQRIAEAVSHYIADMPSRTGHAFLGRRQGGIFRFSGSWSSRMRGGGYHLNHIHDGWISSVYYVDVPNAAADAKGHQGWLKFGEPSVDLGFGDAVRRMIQPKPGRLILFPSYMWHGTVPFHTDEVRTTIAFDAVPYHAG